MESNLLQRLHVVYGNGEFLGNDYSSAEIAMCLGFFELL